MQQVFDPQTIVDIVRSKKARPTDWQVFAKWKADVGFYLLYGVVEFALMTVLVFGIESFFHFIVYTSYLADFLRSQGHTIQYWSSMLPDTMSILLATFVLTIPVTIFVRLKLIVWPIPFAVITQQGVVIFRGRKKLLISVAFGELKEMHIVWSVDDESEMIILDYLDGQQKYLDVPYWGDLDEDVVMQAFSNFKAQLP